MVALVEILEEALVVVHHPETIKLYVDVNPAHNNITVTITGTEHTYTAKTDDDGVATFNEVAYGDYTLNIVEIGYAEHTQNIKINNTNNNPRTITVNLNHAPSSIIVDGVEYDASISVANQGNNCEVVVNLEDTSSNTLDLSEWTVNGNILTHDDTSIHLIIPILLNGLEDNSISNVMGTSEGISFEINDVSVDEIQSILLVLAVSGPNVEENYVLQEHF